MENRELADSQRSIGRPLAAITSFENHGCPWLDSIPCVLFDRGSMSIPSRRGPKPLSEILGELFIARGYGQVRARAELEGAWAAAVGEAACRQTELGEVRRGVLNVTVAHPALLEELSAFSKPKILAALRAGAPGTTVHDIRFRVGALGTAKVAKPRGAALGPAQALSKPKAAARHTGRRTGKDGVEGETQNNPETSES